MYLYTNWAATIPMANEEQDFVPFVDLLTRVMNVIGTGKIYFVIDNASKDKTLELAQDLSKKDPRFEVIWAPENKNVVDAYLTGFKVAYENGHDIIIEMDAGLSHDPRAIPMYLRVLNEGNEVAFGSRFIKDGSMGDSPLNRRMLSKAGTYLANWLLGTKLYDMTSGFQGFHRDVIGNLLKYPLKSRAHFYQTEVKYLLRKHRTAEVPIHYQAPSPRVSPSAIKNARETLLYYFWERLKGNTPVI
ncbi:MAG TPA: glycosyltransferase [Chitinophagales bacterium]|jgi:dolichol-phosphate mannosyltransferase|nr:glycosyltransferase [Chitinophagales bacterium]HOY40645.1 glycosyltransferase [Chitinophagales bacterium]